MNQQQAAILESRTNEFLPEDLFFQVEPPEGDPLVPSSSLSLARADDAINLTWTAPSVERIQAGTERLLDEFVLNAKRDVGRYPEHVYSHINLALALANAGRHDEALGSFEYALKLDPKNYTALVGLARLHAVQMRFDEAERLYNLVLQAKSDDRLALRGMSFIRSRQSRFDEAVAYLNQLVASHPNDGNSHWALATFLMRSKQSRGAISHLKQALRSDPMSAKFHHALGIAYALNDDFGRALKSLRIALRLAPALVETVHAFCKVLIEKGQSAEVIELISSYLEQKPSDIQARELLADAYFASANYKAAFTQLVRILRAAEGGAKNDFLDVVRLTNNVGVCLERLKEFDAAESWWRQSIDLEPRIATPYHNLAGLYLKADRPEVAYKVLSAALKRFPEDQDTILLLVICLEQQNMADEAIESLRRLVSRTDAVAEAFAYLGYLLADFKEDNSEAIKVLKEGYIRFGASNMSLMNNLAYVHLLRGEVNDGRQIIALIRPTGGAVDIPATATRGMLRLHEGAFEKGEALYREAEGQALSKGNKKLAHIVRQKMHLELARAFIRHDDQAKANGHIRQGLLVKDGNRLYRKHLEELGKKIQIDQP